MTTTESNFIYAFSVTGEASPGVFSFSEAIPGRWAMVELPGNVLTDLKTLYRFVSNFPVPLFLLHDLLPAPVCYEALSATQEEQDLFCDRFFARLEAAHYVGCSVFTLDFCLSEALDGGERQENLRRLLRRFYRSLADRGCKLLLSAPLESPNFSRMVDFAESLMFPKIGLSADVELHRQAATPQTLAQKLRRAEFSVEFFRVLYAPEQGNVLNSNLMQTLLNPLGQYSIDHKILFVPRYQSYALMRNEAIFLQSLIKDLQKRPITVTFTGRNYLKL